MSIFKVQHWVTANNRLLNSLAFFYPHVRCMYTVHHWANLARLNYVPYFLILCRCHIDLMNQMRQIFLSEFTKTNWILCELKKYWSESTAKLIWWKQTSGTSALNFEKCWAQNVHVSSRRFNGLVFIQTHFRAELFIKTELWLDWNRVVLLRNCIKSMDYRPCFQCKRLHEMKKSCQIINLRNSVIGLILTQAEKMK